MNPGNENQASSSNTSNINASRRSAFSPYRSSTILTNLQRGNIQTQTSVEPPIRSVHQLAALGELFLCHLDEENANEVDEKGFTPLLWTAFYGQLAAMNQLQEKGASIHVKGPEGETPLLLASANGHTHVVKALLSLGADVNDTDEYGNTALMFAVYGNHKQCVRELLEHGADITPENSNLDTAYSISIKRKFKDVQSLIESRICQMLFTRK